MTDIVDVVWVSHEPGVANRGYWDQGLLEAVFDRSAWRVPGAVELRHQAGFEMLPEDSQGAVVMVPARWYLDRVPAINDGIARLQWCLVILTGDEEGLFPWRDLEHDRMLVWVQTPYPDRHEGVRRLLGDYWPPAAPLVLSELTPPKERTNWFFAGQLNNARRDECVEALKKRQEDRGDGRIALTEAFGAGLAYPEYLEGVVSAKVIPCPSGCFTPDTFRLYEALEAGCIPIVDDAAPNTGDVGYWEFLFGGTPPFPVVANWADFGPLCDELVEQWPARSNQCFAWWQQRKREVAWWLEDDLAELRGTRSPVGGVQDQVTVLIPTSPTPLHPDTSAIEEVIASVRGQEGLGDSEIILMIDGVRDEQGDRRQAYEEYTARLLWLANRHWHNVVPLVFGSHQHQGNMTREALALVRTPLVLFVEHDTPLVGEIEWDGLAQAVLSDRARVIRLHHEASILDAHKSMMLDDRPHVVEGVPLMRTIQWSQRPHLASTDFYRWMTRRYFGHESRTMIEDVMHGVVQTLYREGGLAAWTKFRLWIYTPPGDTKRSAHLDTRAGDPKFDMTFAYDGPAPFGAPRPTAERVD